MGRREGKTKMCVDEEQKWKARERMCVVDEG
jgi:hypothetical protein